MWTTYLGGGLFWFDCIVFSTSLICCKEAGKVRYHPMSVLICGHVYSAKNSTMLNNKRVGMEPNRAITERRREAEYLFQLPGYGIFPTCPEKKSSLVETLLSLWFLPYMISIDKVSGAIQSRAVSGSHFVSLILPLCLRRLLNSRESLVCGRLELLWFLRMLFFLRTKELKVLLWTSIHPPGHLQTQNDSKVKDCLSISPMHYISCYCCELYYR